MGFLVVGIAAQAVVVGRVGLFQVNVFDQFAAFGLQGRGRGKFAAATMNPVPTVRETRSRVAARRGPSTLPPMSSEAEELGRVPTAEMATMLGVTRVAT